MMEGDKFVIVYRPCDWADESVESLYYAEHPPPCHCNPATIAETIEEARFFNDGGEAELFLIDRTGDRVIGRYSFRRKPAEVIRVRQVDGIWKEVKRGE